MELKIVLSTLAVLIFLPAAAVVVVAASGVSLVADALAFVNPTTKMVDLFDPNGNKVASIELSTTWPTTGYVSDEFGTHESWRKALGLGVHSGIDISNSFDTPITTFMDGVVINNDSVDDSPCGKSVTIQHVHNITSLYCHLNNPAMLPIGSKVTPGDVIGYMGSTGTSTGSHLHFTTKVYGILVNPRIFMVGEPPAQ
ncbi:M23 family metallopeptidase [Candidatus Saccharibacteria bacterium]|nr:M23 family metallopeptidase [Candidatus Saccharibacteria bacterium]MCA9348435.1 M23 family metallopeptidase [Candidatus Saccharibacteria bacterium]